MIESFLKGGILLYAKEGIIRVTKRAGLDEVSAGLIGGFGGGAFLQFLICIFWYQTNEMQELHK